MRQCPENPGMTPPRRSQALAMTMRTHQQYNYTKASQQGQPQINLPPNGMMHKVMQTGTRKHPANGMQHEHEQAQDFMSFRLAHNYSRRAGRLALNWGVTHVVNLNRREPEPRRHSQSATDDMQAPGMVQQMSQQEATARVECQHESERYGNKRRRPSAVKRRTRAGESRSQGVEGESKTQRPRVGGKTTRIKS